ncbi:MAG: amidohydrolase family protein [Oscillospiraceae bacterium]
MNNYRIIDAHAHIFPAKIADKAVTSIGKFYGIEMDHAGVSDALIKSGRAINIEKYLVCSTATKPEQVVPINDFIFDECQKHQEFIGFATLHPDMENLDEEVERILQRGFKGIKLHPDFQQFNIDDQKAFEIYKRVQGKLAILFHTGDDRLEFSKPKRLARVSDKFPDLRCIAAHFGGYKCWDEAYEVYDSKNIFMDTSSSLFSMSREQALKFIDKFGVEQFFFGSDFPMWRHEVELKRIESLELDKVSLEKILYGNFDAAILHYK